MKQSKFLSLILFFVLLMGCTISPLHYFSVQPYFKPFPMEEKIPIQLVLLEDVKDSFVVQGEGINKMIVTDFRRSFAESMQAALQRNFSPVCIRDSKPEEGLVLVVYRVRPFWKLNSLSSYSLGESFSSSNSLVSAAFQFESSLFYDNEKLASADLSVYSDDQMADIFQAHAVFKSGLTKACETMIREIFKDETLEKIKEYDEYLK